MKNKILVILSILIIGCLLFYVGYKLGGLSENKFLSGVFEKKNAGSWDQSLSSNDVENSEDFIPMTTVEGVDSLDIDVGLSNLIISSIDEDLISYEVEQISNGKFKSKVKDHKLYISFVRPKKGLFGYNSKNSDTKIKIYIPKNLHLKLIDIDAGVGNIKIDNIKVGRFSLDAGVSSVNIKDSEIKNFKIEQGVGSVSLYNVKIGEDCKVSGGVGSFYALLAGTAKDYDIVCEQGLGGIRINGSKLSSSKGFKDTSKKIHIEGGVGSINIEFSEDK